MVSNSTGADGTSFGHRFLIVPGVSDLIDGPFRFIEETTEGRAFECDPGQIPRRDRPPRNPRASNSVYRAID
jgi:hypothetical protein